MYLYLNHCIIYIQELQIITPTKYKYILYLNYSKICQHFKRDTKLKNVHPIKLILRSLRFFIRANQKYMVGSIILAFLISNQVLLSSSLSFGMSSLMFGISSLMYRISSLSFGISSLNFVRNSRDFVRSSLSFGRNSLSFGRSSLSFGRTEYQ